MTLPLNDQESLKSLSEVVSTEKRLFPLMSSQGILHGDFLEVYREVRTGYEKILLYSNQMVELQEVEYLLWKLHYKHIVEFRKRIGKQSSNIDNIKDTQPENINCQSNCEDPLVGFKVFLSDATKFYRNLIIKLRGSCGLPKEVFVDDKDGSSFSSELTKLCECQFTCHRLLVCLGDLARYAEILKKPDTCEWFIAAAYYLEATKTWPDCGNPHNQLALLGTYIGDAFLALYHCLRSLAIKEPFPDAWRNLVLLFEENTSIQLRSYSHVVPFDFFNPSRRRSLMNKSPAEDGSLTENELAEIKIASPAQSEFWSAMIRTISFFVIRSSLEDFPRTFACMLDSLEALLAVDDMELTTTMESYKLMDSSRRGPYRAIQLVSTFIFMIHSMIDSSKIKASTVNDEKKQSEYTPLALAAVLICMGRITERCLKCNLLNCPLLPAVLIFIEWLAGALDEADAHVADGRVANALSYFFGALSDLLNRLDQNDSRIYGDNNAIWEDHVLRGFYPLARVHEVLDFTCHQECWYDSYMTRAQRIYNTAISIVERSKCSFDWMSHDKEKRVFYTVKTSKCLDQEEAVDTDSDASLEVKEQPYQQTILSMTNEDISSSLKTQPIAEEEEVILFKPIERFNSAPVCLPKSSKDSVCPEVTDTQETLLDKCLCRATTFTIGQQSAENDSFSFCPTVSTSGENWPFKPLEPPSKDSMAQPAGPPSLSGWVVGRGISNAKIEDEAKDYSKHKLTPIDEVASMSLSDHSDDKLNNSEVAQEHISSFTHNSPPYRAPLPSAPFLPDDALWLRMNSLVSTEHKNAVGNEADGIIGAALTSGYASHVSNNTPINVSPGVSSRVDGYPPILGMSSSEWLYHYRNSQNVGNPANRMSSVIYNAPAFDSFPENQV